MRNFVTAAFDHSSPGDGLPAAWLNVYQVGSTLLSCQVNACICLTAQLAKPKLPGLAHPSRMSVQLQSQPPPPSDMATRGQVLVVVFGQELPDAASSAALQLFSLIVAAVGFASFALVLALVEQVVLQVLDTNVRQGGPVYEEGHILVLSLADNQRDQEVIWKILSQVCRHTTTASSATHGGLLARPLCHLHSLGLLADLSLSRSPGSRLWCQPDCTSHMARCTRAPEPSQPAHGRRQPAAGSSRMAAVPATELTVPMRRCAWPTARRAAAAS